ncbi:MAG: hypothetical protein NC131_16975 [Roseburia sp.]|nr:hypothetical protein [Roseburia sp.]
MSDLLNGKVAFNVDTLEVYQDSRCANVLLDEAELNALRWMVQSDAETSFSKRLSSHEVFIGPYIKGAETGYIFQVINLFSRDVTTATVPFEGTVDAKSVKQALAEMLFKGGNANGEEEEQKEVHKEL